MAKPKPQPTQRERVRSHRERVIERTREEIVLASARLLAQNPGKPASMSEIAAELGMTAPALYAYFENKQAIFAAIVRLIQRESDEVFRARSAPGTPFRERLRAFVLRHVELTDRRRDVFLALFSLKFSGEVLAEHRRLPPLAHLEALIAWFEREAKAGDLGACTPTDAATSFYGLVHAFFIRTLLPARGSRAPILDAADRILELFWHGVSSAPRPALKGKLR